MKNKIFHIVIIDLQLPDMDGLHLMREIKKSFSHSECIVLTGLPNRILFIDHPLKKVSEPMIHLLRRSDSIARVKSLIGNSDSAMYSAKSGGRNTYRHYDISINSLSPEKG